MFTMYERSLADAVTIIRQVSADALSRPTPCSDWNLRQLLTHMVGQNDGFVMAVAEGDAPVSAYERTELSDDEVQPEWERSAAALHEAFGNADMDGPVHAVGFGSLTARVVLRMIVLDTIMHTWDVASALGADYRPDDELVGFSLGFAREIASFPVELTAASFGPPLPESGVADGEPPWPEALRLLGRGADRAGRWTGPVNASAVQA